MHFYCRLLTLNGFVSLWMNGRNPERRPHAAPTTHHTSQTPRTTRPKIQTSKNTAKPHPLFKIPRHQQKRSKPQHYQTNQFTQLGQVRPRLCGELVQMQRVQQKLRKER